MIANPQNGKTKKQKVSHPSHSNIEAAYNPKPSQVSQVIPLSPSLPNSPNSPLGIPPFLIIYGPFTVICVKNSTRSPIMH